MGKHRRPRASWRKRQDVTRHSRDTGRWKRRTVLTTAALGGIGAIVVGAGPFTAAGTAEATEMTVEPAGGAGLFDVDPHQGSISQIPDSVVNGDITAFPEDWEF